MRGRTRGVVQIGCMLLEDPGSYPGHHIQQSTCNPSTQEDQELNDNLHYTANSEPAYERHEILSKTKPALG